MTLKRLISIRTKRVSSATWHITALAALRLIRSWNQTGQKFAGEPDIVKMFLMPYPELLWALVGAMYVVTALEILPNLDGLPLVAVTGLTSILVSSAFSFKLAFTAEDSPELVVGFAKTISDTFAGQTLLSRARIVFALLTALSGFAIYRSFTGPPRAVDPSGKLLLPP